mmetsp:Transcript_50263/g.143722  ORF Transcript_50263/g.143722 Transcript_50263/m.143722 type:complete len:224 (-) Transcript_50263:205-876(-)
MPHFLKALRLEGDYSSGGNAHTEHVCARNYLHHAVTETPNQSTVCFAAGAIPSRLNDRTIDCFLQCGSRFCAECGRISTMTETACPHTQNSACQRQCSHISIVFTRSNISPPLLAIETVIRVNMRIWECLTTINGGAHKEGIAIVQQRRHVCRKFHYAVHCLSCSRIKCDDATSISVAIWLMPREWFTILFKLYVHARSHKQKHPPCNHDLAFDVLSPHLFPG